MDDLQRLIAVEEIKRLKAKYCRVMDEKDWDQWRDVFASDAVMLVPEAEARPAIHGVEAIIDFVRALLIDAVTVHHAHAPEITVLNDTEARGIWALDDNLWWPSQTPSPYGWTRLRGAGHYRERYRKIEAGWRIAELELTRLYLDRA